MNGRIKRALLLFSLPLLAACGAKTGLDVPDSGPDAEVPDNDIPCIEVPFDGGPVEVPLETQPQLARADVVFLIDVTASMQDEIDQIRADLRDRLAPGIEREIPDSNLAVAVYGDFPIDPYGATEDFPFKLILPMSDDISRIQAAMNAVMLGNGRDEPEAQTEALYQLATAEGLPGFVPPSFGCPRGGHGYPCFRDGALPIVLHFTDAPMHNGPMGSNAYDSSLLRDAHTFEQAIDALNAIDARVIGFDSGEGAGADDLRAVAAATATLDERGQPLVYDIGLTGDSLGDDVIDAMKVFADTVVFDVDAVMQDPNPDDDIDVRDFVQAIVPLRATPMSSVGEIDLEAGVFRDVKAGATIVFQLVLFNDAVVPGPSPRRFQLEVLFRGDGRTSLGRRTVEIVIPGADGEGCDAPENERLDAGRPTR